MKKTISLILMICLVMSVAVTAFAVPANSPTKKEPLPDIIFDEKTDDGEGNIDVPAVRVTDEADKKSDVKDIVPESELHVYSYGEIGELKEADQKVFRAAYEVAKNEKDRLVVSFFWISVEDQHQKIIDDDNYLELHMRVKGLEKDDNVYVRVNGEEVPQERIFNNGDGTATFYLHTLGAVEIAVDLK